ncbi:MAG: sigma-70 family RNA polymerase sigma factor, partial [Planctomycetaceae bacterium]
MKTLKASPSSRQASLSRQSNTNRPVKTRQNLSVVASARRIADPTLPSRVEGLLRREIAFVHHRGFARTNLDSARRELDLDSSSTSNRVSRPPADVPAYFAELYLTPLLSAEGESRLFRLMNLFKFRANALRATLNVDRPDPLLVAQIEQLLALAAGVRERIIRANLRLVVSIARRFANDICSFDDLVSDGNVALLNAVEKFDFSRGFRFSTYATHAIQRDFFRIIRKRRTEQSRCSLGISEMLANTPDDADPVAEQTEKIRQ